MFVVGLISKVLYESHTVHLSDAIKVSEEPVSSSRGMDCPSKTPSTVATDSVLARTIGT